MGILPLSIEDKVLKFLGSPRSDYNDILCADASDVSVLELALTTLLERRGKPASWQCGLLENISQQSRFMKLLGGLTKTLGARLELALEDECLSVQLSPENKPKPRLTSCGNLKKKILPILTPGTQPLVRKCK